MAPLVSCPPVDPRREQRATVARALIDGQVSIGLNWKRSSAMVSSKGLPTALPHVDHVLVAVDRPGIPVL